MPLVEEPNHSEGRDLRSNQGTKEAEIVRSPDHTNSCHAP